MRGIGVERLPDEEQPADWQAGEEKAKPVTHGLFRKVKAAMKGNGVNSAAKLARSLAELRKVEQRRLELIEWDKAEEQAATELLNELLSQNSAPSRDTDLETFKAAQKEYLRRELDLSPKIQTLREWIGGLSRQSTLARVDDPGNVARVKSQYPELKKILADAICGKFAQVKADADKVAQKVQAELDAEYGGGEHDAEDQTPVKRARVQVGIAEDLLKRVQLESVESVYLSVARYLLP
jgi:hypothetical protein